MGVGRRGPAPFSLNLSAEPAMNALIAAGIVAALLAYLSAGQAYFVLINAVQAHRSPVEHAMSPLAAGLRDGLPAARIARWCFIAFWPAWIGVGWLVAVRDRVGQ